MLLKVLLPFTLIDASQIAKVRIYFKFFLLIYLYSLSIIISVLVPKVKFISKVEFGGKSVLVPKVKFTSKIEVY
tara:strand:- start:883 stop:1104 length:222 start_codon:yes stop_codon:yes gene_type:complete